MRRPPSARRRTIRSSPATAACTPSRPPSIRRLRPRRSRPRTPFNAAILGTDSPKVQGLAVTSFTPTAYRLHGHVRQGVRCHAAQPVHQPWPSALGVPDVTLVTGTTTVSKSGSLAGQHDDEHHHVHQDRRHGGGLGAAAGRHLHGHAAQRHQRLRRPHRFQQRRAGRRQQRRRARHELRHDLYRQRRRPRRP